MTARSILRIVDRPGRIVEGEIRFHQDSGEVVDLARLDPRGPTMRAIRGRDIAMIFQEPMASLSPVHTIGNQIMEAVQLHFRATEREARDRAVELLEQVGIPRPESRLDAYVFQLSGGMRQRAALLRTFLAGYDILLLDEPFGALDALTRRMLQQWLLGVRTRFSKTILFITHDVDEALLLGDRMLVFSPRPGRITADLKIDLPHPRDENTILEPEFLALKRNALAHLKL